MAIVLLAGYTVYATRLPDRTKCGCFGDAFEFGGSKRIRILRNVVLLAIGFVGALHLEWSTRLPSPSALAAGVVIFFVLFALDRFVETSRDFRAALDRLDDHVEVRRGG